MTNTVLHQCSLESNLTMERISKRKLEQYRRSLSERDKAILRSIHTCRFLRTDQIKRLHFRGLPTDSAVQRATARTAAKLHNMGLIQPLKRRIGGVRAGSASYVWTLRMAGQELLRIMQNPHTKPSRKRVFESTFIFLAHTLAVAEVYTRLRTMENIQLMKVESEPECWRKYIADYGRNFSLKPDLYAVTAANGYEYHYFFEVDLDTESPSRIIRKCEYYGNYYLTGTEQKRTGVFPRVVWIAPDKKRRETLSRHINEHLSDYKNLFAVITLQELGMFMTTDSPSAVMGQAQN